METFDSWYGRYILSWQIHGNEDYLFFHNKCAFPTVHASNRKNMSECGVKNKQRNEKLKFFMLCKTKGLSDVSVPTVGTDSPTVTDTQQQQGNNSLFPHVGTKLCVCVRAAACAWQTCV